MLIVGSIILKIWLFFSIFECSYMCSFLSLDGTLSRFLGDVRWTVSPRIYYQFRRQNFGLTVFTLLSLIFKKFSRNATSQNKNLIVQQRDQTGEKSGCCSYINSFWNAKSCNIYQCILRHVFCDKNTIHFLSSLFGKSLIFLISFIRMSWYVKTFEVITDVYLIWLVSANLKVKSFVWTMPVWNITYLYSKSRQN